MKVCMVVSILTEFRCNMCNILNSSVDCVEWSVVVFFRKSHMYAHHQIRLNELINMMYFIFNLNAYFSRN